MYLLVSLALISQQRFCLMFKAFCLIVDLVVGLGISGAELIGKKVAIGIFFVDDKPLKVLDSQCWLLDIFLFRIAFPQNQIIEA